MLTWAIHGPKTPDRHCQRALVIFHYVRNHSRRSGDHYTSEQSCDEAHNQQGSKIFGERARYDQNREDEQAGYADRLPAVQFAQWRHKHGSHSQTDEVQSQSQRNDGGGSPEFSCNLRLSRGVRC